VGERTAALDLANKQLSYELDERQKVVQQLSQREIELEKMLLIVERSNRELESFAYITSHDLQEPLRKIQAFGDRLNRRYKAELGEEGGGFVQRMVSAANRMQLMINDLLDYSRITTRAGEFVPVNLNQVTHEILSDLELRILETKAQVSVADLPTIRSDRSQMRQLLQNLVLNALKFHRLGTPPVIQIGCEQAAQDGGNGKVAELQLFVQDNGIGFEEKYLDRIFLPFQRLHGQDIYEGSGIGLAICRKIAERHGGSITAKSTPGSGSRFIVKLPKYPVLSQGEET
jgi:light-regulated signal transduction histidine kinase (bacteriophytochrome)